MRKSLLLLMRLSMLPLLLLCLLPFPTGCSLPREGGEATGTEVPINPEPEKELRGVWVATVGNLNFPSRAGLSEEALRQELDDLLSVCAECRLNAVFFQVRPTADSLYRSEIFPTSSFLSGEQGKEAPGGFDPLLYLTSRAREKEIDVYAWINPLRITYGSKARPQQDPSALAENNPARRHPEWTVPYADGKLYFDPGIPEVRELIAAGASEVAANYPVKGIVFDDSFYPYPVENASFPDEKSYLAYGNGADREDWRQENVNRLLAACRDAVKKASPDCRFGVSPFGIWQNDDGENGGSATRGLEAYRAVYCDALAWAKGGYVDFLAPQIYWSFDTPAAPFGVLAEWWNDALAGTGVRFYIANAAYKIPEWESAEELSRQVEFSRQLSGYGGSILYSYAALRDNLLSVREVVSSLFSDAYPVNAGA